MPVHNSKKRKYQFGGIPSAMPQAFRPVQSTFVPGARHAPIPLQPIAQTVGAIRQERDRTLEGIDALEDTFSQVSSLREDQPILNSAVQQARERLSEIADSPELFGNLRNVRQVAREFQQVLQPIRQRQEVLTKASENLRDKFSGSQFERRMAAVRASLPELNEETLATGTFTPQIPAFSEPIDLIDKARQIGSDIKPFVSQGNFTQDEFDLLTRRDVESVPRELVERAVTVGLLGGEGGEFIREEAALRAAENPNISFEDAMNDLLGPAVQVATDLFARTTEKNVTRTDPTKTGDGDIPQTGFIRTGMVQTSGQAEDFFELGTELEREKEEFQRLAREGSPTQKKFAEQEIERLNQRIEENNNTIKAFEEIAGVEEGATGEPERESQFPGTGSGFLGGTGDVPVAGGTPESRAARERVREEMRKVFQPGEQVTTMDIEPPKQIASIERHIRNIPAGELIVRRHGTGGESELLKEDEIGGLRRINAVSLVTPVGGRPHLRANMQMSEDEEPEIFDIHILGSDAFQRLGERIEAGSRPGTDENTVGFWMQREGPTRGSGVMSRALQLQPGQKTETGLRFGDDPVQVKMNIPEEGESPQYILEVAGRQETFQSPFKALGRLKQLLEDPRSARLIESIQ